MFSISQITSFTKRLFPKGIGLRFKDAGNIDSLIKGVSGTSQKYFEGVHAIYDSMMPDNDNFSIADADAWEKKIGIIQAPGVGLDDRKAAIYQKMFFPVYAAPRQHYLFIQDQLRAAGFDVYIHLNPSGLSPEEILSPIDALFHGDDVEHADAIEHASFAIINSQHDSDLEHGDEVEHGASFDNVVVNYLERDRDASYLFANNFKFAFYIAGPTLTEFADVTLSRREEFRQLILQLKPMHTQAFLFINFF